MRKLKNPYLALLLVGGLAVTTSSCKDDEPEPDEVQGSISSLRIEFTPKGQNVAPISAFYSDEDETDDIPPVISGTLNLDPATTYTVTVALTDESKDPPVDLSARTKKAQDYHEFFYIKKDGLLLDVVKTDRDSNGLPVGFTAEATTPEELSTGKLQVVLKHMKKNSQILKSSTSDVRTGSTDFVATFPVVVD